MSLGRPCGGAEMVNLYLYVVGAMMMMVIAQSGKGNSLWFALLLCVLWPIAFPIIITLGIAMRDKNG